MSTPNAIGGNVWKPHAGIALYAGTKNRYKRFKIYIAATLIAIIGVAFLAFRTGLPVVNSVASSGQLTLTTSEVSIVPLLILSTLVAILICLVVMAKKAIDIVSIVAIVCTVIPLGMLFSFYTFSLSSSQSERIIVDEWLKSEVGTSTTFSEISESSTRTEVGFYTDDNLPLVIEYTETAEEKILTAQPIAFEDIPEEN